MREDIVDVVFIKNCLKLKYFSSINYLVIILKFFRNILNGK